jgi:hypothetical protein
MGNGRRVVVAPTSAVAPGTAGVTPVAPALRNHHRGSDIAGRGPLRGSGANRRPPGPV